MNHTTHPVEHEEVMAWVDGQLEAARAAEVAAHVEQCAECQTVAADLRRVSQHMAAWQVEPAPQRLSESVTAALPKNEPTPQFSPSVGLKAWLLGWRWKVAAGFAILVVIVTFYFSGMSRYRDETASLMTLKQRDAVLLARF